MHKSNRILSLLHQNIAGLLNKIDNIELSLLQLKQRYNTDFDVLCFSETFIKRGAELNTTFKNYKVASYFSRENEKRGGSCILLKKNLNFKPIDITQKLACTYEFECCGIELINIKIIIVCVYRTPNSNIHNFLQKLDTLLLTLTKKTKYKIVICGDWNIDILKNNNDGKNLTSILHNYNLSCHINQPTRHNSCLDQIASNIAKSKIIGSYIHYLGLSDHETAQAIHIAVDKLENMTHWFEYKRDFSAENRQKFINCISALTFSELYSLTDTNRTFNIFHDTIILFFNLCFPFIKIKITQIKKQKWLTKGLKTSSIQKRRLYLKYKFSRVNKKKMKVIIKLITLHLKNVYREHNN